MERTYKRWKEYNVNVVKINESWARLVSELRPCCKYLAGKLAVITDLMI